MRRLHCSKLPQKQYVLKADRFSNFKNVKHEKSQFDSTRTANILKEFNTRKTAEETKQEHGVSKVSLYKWRQRYHGMEAKELKRIKGLENIFESVED